MKIKLCSICKKSFLLEDFYSQASACKICSKKRRKELYQLNKEHIAVKQKKLYIKHGHKRRAYSKKWRDENIERAVENLKKWKKENPTYKKDRWASDINFRIRENLRGRIFKAVKGLTKEKSSLKLIGCTVEELRAHLESKFTTGMNWQNYGKWHIDHIKPCKLFDLTKTEEQEKCFHYTNLQPLWAIDNLIKNSKYEQYKISTNLSNK